MSDKDLSPVQNKARPKKRRWGKIVLTLSLALNLLFIGSIVGAGWMRHKYRSGWQGPPGFMVKHMLRHLPKEKRQSILEQIARHRKDIRPRFKEIDKRMGELKEALKADPFNAEQVKNLAAKLQVTRQQIVEAKTDLLISSLSRLTPEERRELLESHLFRRLFNRSRGWSTRRFGH